MLTIGDIMSTDVYTLAASTPAEQAALELSVRGFTGAPVCGPGGRLIGVLSRSDLADPERGGGDLRGRVRDLRVRDLMTPAIFTLEPSAPVVHAARLMLREGIRRIIVAEKSGRMVGIVTATDVLQLLAGAETSDDLGEASSRAERFRADQTSVPA